MGRPDAIMCHYPVFSVDINRFFPSLLISLDEELLSAGFMMFALACFSRKGGNPDKSPIMSPIYAPNKIIQLLPPCHFMVAEIDGLRDQSYAMALRILKNQGQVNISHMKDYIHGFCNLDTNHVG